MMATVTVVHVETALGVLGVELYDEMLTNGVSTSFLRLAVSGQLEGNVFRSLVPGVGLVGAASGASDGRTLGLPWAPHSDAAAFGRSGTPQLRHVGAGLLTCRPVIGEVAAATFLITLSPQPKLDGEYVVFGRICSGMAVLERVTKMHVADDFKLYSPINVLRCTIVRQPKASRPVAPSAAATPVEAEPAAKVVFKSKRSVLASLE